MGKNSPQENVSSTENTYQTGISTNLSCDVNITRPETDVGTLVQCKQLHNFPDRILTSRISDNPAAATWSTECGVSTVTRSTGEFGHSNSGVPLFTTDDDIDDIINDF